jgi:predicted  nucleic acid-binding Zn-ribbon protein
MTIKTQLTGLENRIQDMEDQLSVYVTSSDLQSYLNDINSTMNDYNDALSDLENRLAKVVLPTDTRYFLTESEITDFRDNFRKLRIMMSEVEKSRQSMIRLLSRYNLTASTL